MDQSLSFSRMDNLNPAPIVCHCGRSFQQDNAYSSHRRSCKKSNKRTREVLEKSKELHGRKKLRLQLRQDASEPGPSDPTTQNQVRYCLMFVQGIKLNQCN